MAAFKIGERVRLSAMASDDRRYGSASYPGVGDLHGTVLEYMNGRPVVDWDGGKKGFYNNPPEYEIELAPDEPYDRRTAEALAQTFRDKAMLATATLVLRHFEEMTAPKRKKVVVEFDAPAGENVENLAQQITALTDIKYTIKEDN